VGSGADVASSGAVAASSGAVAASSGAVAASSGAKDDSADDSALSSKRFVYASFFNRLKRRVFEHWAPQTARLRHRATEAAVEVRIQLSRSGALAGICVITPSGSSEFDDEAVRAFQAAAPFPDPPEGLVGKDELITFPFTFHLTPE
jgi:TonB family protein